MIKPNVEAATPPVHPRNLSMHRGSKVITTVWTMVVSGSPTPFPAIPPRFEYAESGPLSLFRFRLVKLVRLEATN